MTVALLSHPDCLLHDMGPSHPECPQRLQFIEEYLVNAGLNEILQYHLAPLATKEQLHRVHDVGYVDSIFQASPQSGMISLDPDTWMNPYTLTAALRAAGAVVAGVDLVMSGEVNSAFCSIRPPGHHAERAQAMGFCFFNNIAVGVAHALEHYQLKRIAIIDFDVHHGNGTENIFQDDRRILLCSSFQHPFYPFSGAETHSEHIFNLPLSAGTRGLEFREKIKAVWLPAIEKFKPDMIFFSAGFDGHAEDTMSNLLLHERDYEWVTREIKLIADKYSKGRMVSALEGGYALPALGRSAVAHLQALL